LVFATIIMPMGYGIGRLPLAVAECGLLDPGHEAAAAVIHRALFATYRPSDEGDHTIGFACEARLLSTRRGLPERAPAISLWQGCGGAALAAHPALAKAGILGRQ
jgi:hypothetical protein